MVQTRYYFKNKKSALQNLPEDQVALALKLYQQRTPIEKIKNQLAIQGDLNKRNFYKLLPYEKSTADCYCGSKLFYKISPNTNPLKIKFLCLSCGHYEAPWCQCDECVKTRNLRREEGMREFTICMMDYLFPDEKLYADDPFDTPKT
ncbi:hypothetical protein [Sphingobacterium sp. LZ9M9]|nr:hypothetical protein [Sphingobacterium sp. LZ9M9]